MRDLSKFAEDGARLVGDYRWPVVSTPYARWSYITALVVNERDGNLWPGIMPTEAEIAVVNSFHEEYIAHWYNTGWLNRMREKHPLDLDGGANTRYLLKYGDGNWKYRLFTWEHGPWPFYDAEPMDLLPLLDHIHHSGTRWYEWKASHAEVFEAVTA